MIGDLDWTGAVYVPNFMALCHSDLIAVAAWHLSLRFDNYGNMTLAAWHWSFRFHNCCNMTLAP